MSLNFAETLAVALIGGLAASLVAALLQIRASRTDERTRQLRESYATWVAALFAYADAIVEHAEARDKIPQANREYNQAKRSNADPKYIERKDQAAAALESAVEAANEKIAAAHLRINEARFRVLLLERDGKTIKAFEEVLPSEVISVNTPAEAQEFKMRIGERISKFCMWYSTKHC